MNFLIILWLAIVAGNVLLVLGLWAYTRSEGGGEHGSVYKRSHQRPH